MAAAQLGDQADDEFIQIAATRSSTCNGSAEIEGGGSSICDRASSRNSMLNWTPWLARFGRGGFAAGRDRSRCHRGTAPG